MDLPEFIKALEEKGQLKRVRKKVDLNYELASVVVKSDMVNGPAMLFEHPGEWDIPVVSSLLSSMDRIATGLQIESDKVLSRVSEALNNPIPPVSTRNSPAKEVIDNDPDLVKLFPIPVHAERDGGQYISASVATSMESELRSLSYVRLQVKGPKKMGINIDPPRRLRRHLEKAEQENRPLEIAICIGGNPAVELAAAAKTNHDKIAVAGAMQKKPIEMVKCETVNLEVPADSEIVIEGRIPPGVKEPEGPFAEFAGYYGEVRDRPIVEVSCVTYRKGPTYRTIVGSGKEHLVLGNVIAREPVLYQMVKYSVPSTTAVHIPPHASGFMAIIQIDKKVEGESRNAILAAFASHPNIKYVVVVDNDVDIHDPKDVEWAIATRSQADEDVIVVPGALGHWMDPSSKDGVTAKLGIDATIPMEKKHLEKFIRVKFPGVEKIDLQQYLS